MVTWQPYARTADLHMDGRLARLCQQQHMSSTYKGTFHTKQKPCSGRECRRFTCCGIDKRQGERKTTKLFTCNAGDERGWLETHHPLRNLSLGARLLRELRSLTASFSPPTSSPAPRGWAPHPRSPRSGLSSSSELGMPALLLAARSGSLKLCTLGSPLLHTWLLLLSPLSRSQAPNSEGRLDPEYGAPFRMNRRVSTLKVGWGPSFHLTTGAANSYQLGVRISLTGLKALQPPWRLSQTVMVRGRGGGEDGAPAVGDCGGRPDYRQRPRLPSMPEYREPRWEAAA